MCYCLPTVKIALYCILSSLLHCLCLFFSLFSFLFLCLCLCMQCMLENHYKRTMLFFFFFFRMLSVLVSLLAFILVFVVAMSDPQVSQLFVSYTFYSIIVDCCLPFLTPMKSDKPVSLLGGSGGAVNSLDFCLASLKSLGCFYFWYVLSSQCKAVTVNSHILRCQF